ncbi:MAG: anti-sigma factor [Ignavibacteriota bacterium]
MSKATSFSLAQQEHLEELSAAYVLGSLSEDKEGLAEFESLIESGDPHLAQTLEQMLGASVTLALAVPAVEPPAALRTSLMESIGKVKQTTDNSTTQQDSFTEKRSPVPSQDALRLKTRTRYFIGTSILSGLLLCTLVAMNVSKSAKLDRSNDLMKALLHQTDSLRAISGTDPTTHPTDSLAAVVTPAPKDSPDLTRFFAMFGESDSRLVTLASAPMGTTRQHLFFSPRQRMVSLLRENLRPLDANKSYVLWAIVGNKAPVAIGSFRVDGKNTPQVLNFPTKLKSADSFAISVEPGSGGSVRRGNVIFTGSVPKSGLN